MAGRPVARHYDDGDTLELTRLCTDGTRNAASKLLGMFKRAGLGMGYGKLITYTRADKSGASLRAAGFKVIADRPVRSWAKSSAGRPRVDKSEPYQRLL